MGTDATIDLSNKAEVPQMKRNTNSPTCHAGKIANAEHKLTVCNSFAIFHFRKGEKILSFCSLACANKF